MTDAHLRELERRFRETGSPEDEAAWLRGRLQAGELEDWQLDLAARLGHPAAREVRPQAPQHDTLGFWIDDVYSEFGTAALVRALIAVARSTLRGPRGTALDAARSGEFLRNIGLAEAWVACSCFPAPPHRIRVSRLAERRCQACLQRAQQATQVVWDQPQADADARALELVALAPSEWLTMNYEDWGSEFQVGWLEPCERLGISLAEARGAAAAELVPWTLGYGDPVRERVPGGAGG